MPQNNIINLIPIILSGGSGSRLWPLSRRNLPKPFVKINNKKSLYELTLNRVSKFKYLVTKKNKSLVFNISSSDYFYEIDSVVDKKLYDPHYVLEPISRNTGPSIFSATKIIYENVDPNAFIISLPSDHIINDDSNFAEIINNATELIAKAPDKVCLFGIKPDSPDINYGYIETTTSKEELKNISRFIEKPCLLDAKKFYKKHNLFWNSGIFLFKAETMLEMIKIHQKDQFKLLNKCIDSSSFDLKKSNKIYLDLKTYKKLNNISIDYSIIEKTDNLKMIECNAGWSDIGSWESFEKAMKDDFIKISNKNNIYSINSNNNFVLSETNSIGLIDINNLSIIQHDNALLISKSDQSSQVKKIVEMMEDNHDPSINTSSMINRPWGNFKVLFESVAFKIKLIEILPKQSISLQKHLLRSEHWVVVEGIATIQKGTDIFKLCKNESTYIPIKKKHKISNQTTKTLKIVEVQCGSYVGEDDIIRYEDDYGRI
jgi:mannose-1-phosphate guanylyltransferase/mannose-6-phosphate isomerase